MRKRQLFLIASFFIFFAAGCNLFQPKLPLSTPAYLRGDTAKIREEMLKIIPIGTSHEDTERIVESLGLVLTEPNTSSAEGLHIQCQYEGKRGLFDHTIWLIQINLLDGKVADLFCEQIEIDNGFFDLALF